jgi:hypothetical protein
LPETQTGLLSHIGAIKKFQALKVLKPFIDLDSVFGQAFISKFNLQIIRVLQTIP